MPAVEDDIIHSYTHEFDESARLSSDIGPLEKLRTQELLLRFIPKAPAVVYDVGGAVGPYSFWLASIGYSVHLLDIVPIHIDKAKALAAESTSPKLMGMYVGDARMLPFNDESADVVIIHGPMYHLPTLEDRLRCLREGKRVLKPGGRLFAFGITRYAGLIYSIVRGKIFKADQMEMVSMEVKTGLRRSSANNKTCFRSAYFHLPHEMEAEAREAGLSVKGTFGIIGPAWQVPNLDQDFADESHRAIMVEIARMTEGEPVLGPRFMTMCEK